jgi:STE24 endopeptidase
VNEDKAARYNRHKRRAGVLSVVGGAVLLIVVVVSPASLRMRDAAWSIAPAAPVWLHRSAVVTTYVVGLTILNELFTMPLGYYSGFLLERRYGLSRQAIGAWLVDQLKGMAIGFVLGAAAANVLYALIARFGDAWWLPAGLAFAAMIVGLANLAPVIVLPLFYSVKPLSRDELRQRLLALADRAGARVLGAYEWGLGSKTSRANAALTGIGHSRRILVSDTMLSQYSDEEIEVVLAHELAHHVHGDIWKGIALETVLVMAGFYCASRVLEIVGPIAGLYGPDDVAGLPILLIAAGAVSLVMLPLARAMSRAYERRADRFALTMTRNAPAFVSVMKRLAAQNLAEEEPSRLVQWLFYSHPPIRERIAAAHAFDRQP